MSSKFICSQCGQCCSHIRGLISEEDKKFLKEYAYGKMPLVAVKPIEEISFPLWDWESKRFIKAADEQGINHMIEPSRVMFDLNDDQSIVVTYSINSDSCTFLKDNKCAIYGVRGFICHLFPFQHGPFLRMEGGVKKENMFGSCPSITNILSELNDQDQKQFVQQLYDSFGDAFLAVVQSDIITEWINSKIIWIMRNRLIRPALNYPYDKLLKRIENSSKIDFTDFLVKQAMISKGDMEKTIERFESYQDAKDKLKPFLE